MKSVKRKGLAAVDGDCPNADKFHVFCEGSLVWDCMLNQTNIQNNNNKYYLIQVDNLVFISSRNNNKFCLF